MVKRHRVLKIIALVIVAGLFVLGCGIWYVLTHLTDLTQKVFAQRYPELQVSVDDVRLTSLTGVKITGIMLTDRELDPAHSSIAIDRIALDVDWSLMQGLMFTRFDLTGLIVTLNEVEGVLPIISRFQTEEESSRTIDAIQIQQGALRLAIADMFIATDFSADISSLNQPYTMLVNAEADSCTFFHPDLPLDEVSGTIKLRLLQHENGQILIEDGMAQVNDQQLSFSGAVMPCDTGCTGTLAVVSDALDLSVVSVMLQSLLPQELSMQGASNLNADISFNYSDTIAVGIQVDASVISGSADYAIGNEVLVLQGMALDANVQAADITQVSAWNINAWAKADTLTYSNYRVNNLTTQLRLIDERLEVTDLIGHAYDGRIVGNAVLDFAGQQGRYDMEFGINGLNAETIVRELKPKDVYLSGIGNGSFSGNGTLGKIGEFMLELRAEPEGGVIRIADAATFLNELPGGEETVSALKASLGAVHWDKFVDSMKHYQYKTGSFQAQIDPVMNEMVLLFRFTSKDPKVGDRNLDFVVHDIDKGLIPKVEY